MSGRHAQNGDMIKDRSLPPFGSGSAGRLCAAFVGSWLLIGAAGPALGAECDYPPSGKAAAYKAPAAGTEISFEETTERAGKTKSRREIRFVAQANTGDEADWGLHRPDGGGYAIRIKRGLMALGTSRGFETSFGADALDPLWPLDGGRSIRFRAKIKLPDGMLYGAIVSFCVRRRETIKIAGTAYEALVVDKHELVSQGGERLPHDEVFTRFWYVPDLGIYLRRARAVYRTRQQVATQILQAVAIKR